ncbi:SpaA isopeptide-forming pilin-related protein [Sporosarcina jiandibaonis]|uniref:SpaA isopeptide-forming pilin-related protein n=1 Tax=Sporosarcina jiandibaonis TaxID=2715535 RepID=UPI001553C207|nr:SpaA isopeptide-forming pilin-related protein [Sporosarcina jiandibaonis]
MQIKKLIAVMMIALLTFMTMATGEVANAEANEEVRTTGSLTIYKYEVEPGYVGEDGDGSAGQQGDIPKDDAVLIDDVEFTIIKTHDYDPVLDKWTPTVEDFSDVKLTVDGVALFDNLKLGRYTVEETAGPKNVNLNTNIYSVDIPMTSANGTDIYYNVHIYPKNEIIRGAVELFKENSEAGTGLDGVMFDLYEKNNATPIKTDLPTENGGKIQVDALLYGEYYFQETATVEGFVLNGAEHHFKIEASGKFTGEIDERGTIVKVTVKNYHEPKIEKTINGKKADLPINRETEFEYNLNITLPSDIQNYQSFIVKDELDARLAYGGTWTVEGVDKSALAFSQEGQMLKWTVDNFAALAGVKSIKINFKANVKTEATAGEPIANIGKIDYQNGNDTEGNSESNLINVVPTAGSLTVNKVDEKGNALSGANFELRNSNGDVVETGTGGTILWTELDYGEYTLHEVIAPDGYRKLLKPIEVTIDATEANVIINVVNSKSGWDLPKTGGIGTTLFSGIGLLLMGAAVFIYARREKPAIK